MRQISKHFPVLTFTSLLALSSISAFAQTIENSVTTSYTSGWYGVGQSFTATLNGRVEAISVRPTEGSQEILQIYDNGYASGTPVLTQNVTLVPVAPNGFQKITLSTPLSVTAGAQYSFIVAGDPRIGYSTDYPGGQFTGISNAGSSVTQLAEHDLTFQVFEVAKPLAAATQAVPSMALLGPWGLASVLGIGGIAFYMSRRRKSL